MRARRNQIMAMALTVSVAFSTIMPSAVVYAEDYGADVETVEILLEDAEEGEADAIVLDAEETPEEIVVEDAQADAGAFSEEISDEDISEIELWEDIIVDLDAENEEDASEIEIEDTAALLADESFDNATTLPDGEYIPDSAQVVNSKGSSVGSVTKVVVADGKAAAQIKFDSDKITHVYLFTPPGKPENTDLYDPDTDVCGQDVYATKEQVVTIPVKLNETTAFGSRTVAMSAVSRWMTYTYNIVISEPAVRTYLTVTNTTSMFKILEDVGEEAAYLETKGRQMELVFVLSGVSYSNFFKGTYEEALANGDNRENWITCEKLPEDYFEGKTAKYGYYCKFRIPVSKQETFIPVVAISDTYLGKYENGENALERAFYPRQIILDADAKTIVTGDYDETFDAVVSSDLETFKVADNAKMRVIGGPNSNNYTCKPVLRMLDDVYDQVTYPTIVNGAIGEATATLTAENTFEISLVNAPAKEAFKDKEPISMQFRVKATGETIERKVTIDKVNRTIAIDGEELFADYTAVDVALKKIPSDISNYTETTVKAVTDAKSAVIRDLYIYKQDEVDAMAKAIEDAVANLKEKAADYAAVDAALKKIPADLSKYTDDSVKAVTDAKAAVVRNLPASKQSQVDAMAKKIEAAVAALKKKPVAAAAGTKLTQGGAGYKVLAGSKTVSYTGPTSKKVTSATIPNTVTVGGITYKVTAIAANAFKNCKKLKSVKIGSNITTIGKNAFRNCTALKSVTIPKKVTTIGANAFAGCKSLTKVTIKSSVLKKVGKKAFSKAGSKNYKKLTVKVPKKKLKTYKNLLKKAKLSTKATVKK